MPPKIISHQYEPLTYYILDHYNSQLKCEGCQKTWTKDGTAFMRDQGGTKDGMYYRQFRCKGKTKGRCSTSYTHQDFLSLAIRQLGFSFVEQIKTNLGLNFSLPTSSSVPLSPTTIIHSSNKRSHDGISFGYTPSTKRISSSLSITTSPPLFFPDNRETFQVYSISIFI